MSVELIGEVLHYSRSKGTARVVLLALAYHQHHKDSSRRVGMLGEDLATEANISESTLHRVLNELYETSEVVRLEGGGGRGRGDLWQVANLVELYDGRRLESHFRRPRRPETLATPPANAPGIPPANTPSNGRVSPRVTKAGTKDPREGEPRRSPAGDAAAGIFAYWQQACTHPGARPSADRLSKVRARLREGYTEEDIRTAIDGAARAAFVNDQGKRFDDLELICRNGSKLESFMQRAEVPSRRNGHNGFARPNGAAATPAGSFLAAAAELDAGAVA